jgi:hypothetical protein
MCQRQNRKVDWSPEEGSETDYYRVNQCGLMNCVWVSELHKGGVQNPDSAFCFLKSLGMLHYCCEPLFGHIYFTELQSH